ncbi:DUF5363 family protein [Vibrio sp. HN007]|uniref:DUF5363 family protein n=1 Tax=Vibrio iocasae TaxID=3098914 RepID=UPI0035D463A8
MLEKLKSAVKKYDKWCEEMGLTKEQGRCCVPIRKEDYSEQQNKKAENKDSESV